MTIDTITIILFITVGNLLTGSFVFADIFKKQNIENRMAFVIINRSSISGSVPHIAAR